MPSKASTTNLRAPRRLADHLQRQAAALEAYRRLLASQEGLLADESDARSPHLEQGMVRERELIADLEARGRVIDALTEALVPRAEEAAVREVLAAPTAAHDAAYRRAVAQHRRLVDRVRDRRDRIAEQMKQVQVPRRARSVYRQTGAGSQINVVT